MDGGQEEQLMMARVVLGAALVFGLASCSIPDLPGRATATLLDTATPWPTITARPTETSTAPPVSATPQPTPDHSWIIDAPLAQAATYEIPPSLQYLTADTAWIYFSALNAEGLALHLWPESDPWAYREIGVGGGQNGLVVTGLMPETIYLARVLAVENGEPRAPRFMDGHWSSLRFETMAIEPDSLRVGVIGDSGFGDPITAALVEQLAAHEVDFVVHTGDVVYRGEENDGPVEAFAVKYYEPFRPLLGSVPVYPVLGNHEYDLPVRLNDLPYYHRAFPRFPDALGVPGGGPHGRDWYSLQFGTWEFLFLNTQTFFGVPGSEEQLDWLEEQLSSGPDAKSILAMHVPPFSQGRHQGDSAWVATNLSPLIETYPVVMTVGGHDHNYQYFRVDGAHHIVSGGGSATIYRVPGTDPALQVAAAASHVVILELRSGEAEILVLDPDGVALDRQQFTLDSR